MTKRRGRRRFQGRARLPQAFRAQGLRLWWLLGPQFFFGWMALINSLSLKIPFASGALFTFMYLFNFAAIWQILKLRRRIGRWIHAEPPVCAGCEYPLASDAAACAECGLSANVQERVMRRYLRRNRIWMLA